MIELFFVRHGQTQWNQIRKLQGIQDSPLTTEGIAQTMALEKTLVPFDLILCSPLGRAVQTATILAGESSIQLEPLLVEMGFGSAEGLEKETFKELYSKPFFDLWHLADRYDPSLFGGETFKSLEFRARSFLESLKNKPDGTKILIIGHGMMLKMIFGVIWNHKLDQFWNDPVPLNTSMTRVELSDGHFSIVDFSKVDHLDSHEVISYV